MRGCILGLQCLAIFLWGIHRLKWVRKSSVIQIFLYSLLIYFVFLLILANKYDLGIKKEIFC